MENRLSVFYKEKPSYDIVFENSFHGILKELLPFSLKERKLCIVTDSIVGFLYADELKEILLSAVFKVTIFTFPAGEINKNLTTVQRLYEFLIEQKFDRNDMLVALGGGVVGDLTGFAAATYLRGIRFIQVPTTLLAMSDSSVGGKTGVDLEAYKNMIGAFYMPKLVYMNVSTLLSLDNRQYYAGFGEVIKHGLIKQKEFYQWLKENEFKIKAKEYSILKQMVYKNCKIKKEVVEHDPFEQGERALLNFGHTIGHAVEKLLDFKMFHGECVSIGMAAASFISMRRNMITKEELYDILTMNQKFFLPINIHESKITEESVLEAVSRDKKKDSNKIKFILLDGIGHAVIDTTVTKQEMSEAVSFILGKIKFD